MENMIYRVLKAFLGILFIAVIILPIISYRTIGINPYSISQKIDVENIRTAAIYTQCLICDRDLLSDTYVYITDDLTMDDIELTLKVQRQKAEKAIQRHKEILERKEKFEELLKKNQ